MNEKKENEAMTAQENDTVTDKCPSNHSEYAQWAQEKLVEHFWNESTKSVINNCPYSEDKEEGLNYWWKAHAVDAMIDGYERTKDEIYAGRAESIIDNIISRNGSLYNEFYDDMEWLALACLRLYDDTGNEKMKEYSINLWNDIKTAWWTDEIGGLAWKKDEGRKSRNSCSNGPGSILAARLYQRFRDESDLEWAIKIFEFEKKHLVDKETGMVYDGMEVKADGTLNINKKWLFTYNAGTYIGAAVELYRITEDDKYLAEAEKTAKSSMEQLTTIYGVTKNEGDGDGGMFKGILIRYLVQLYEVNKDKSISDYILANAKILEHSGVAPDIGLIGPDWNKIPQAPLDVTFQLSGVFLLEAAAKVAIYD